MINAVIGQAQPQLGQVNGALGATVGNLLNGKKTAIGIFGALLTKLLAAVPFGECGRTGGASGNDRYGRSRGQLSFLSALRCDDPLGRLGKI